MRVVAHGDLLSYADRVRPLLLEDEALHNLPLGVLGQLAGGLYDDRVLLTVEDGGGVVGMALRTPPWPWTVACFEPAVDAFAQAVAGHLARSAVLPAEVSGERGVVAAVADRWAVAADAVAAVGMAMRIMDCTEVLAPRAVPGTPRPVAAGDLDLLVDWMVTFEAETGAAREPTPPSDLRDMIGRSIAEGRSPLWVWEQDGRVVSLAGIGRPTGSGERVGPVYTPVDLRGRGYAGALVAHLTQDAFDRGCRHVFLFTDAANPVSNRLYERLGYHHVADAARYDLSPR